MVANEVQYQDDYLNDVDCRDIIEGVLAVLPPQDKPYWTDRVGRDDATIRKVLVPTEECLWGQEDERQRGYTTGTGLGGTITGRPRSSPAWRTF